MFFLTAVTRKLAIARFLCEYSGAFWGMFSKIRLDLFLSVNILAIRQGHELANSFLLFRVHKCFLQMIKILSLRQRLQFLLALSYDLQLLSTFPCTWKDLLASLRLFEGPHLFGQFRLVSSLRVSEAKDVKWFLYRSLKLVAIESNVWFCCCPSRYSRLVNHVLSEAITVKKPECPLKGNCLQLRENILSCCNRLTSKNGAEITWHH